MKSKTVGIFVLSLSLLVPAIQAAQEKARQPDPEQLRERLEQIKSRLKLTPEQVEQIRPVLRQELQKLKTVRDKYNGRDQNRRTRLQMARELRDIQGAADDQLRKILSKKQMEEMKKIRQEWRQQVRDRLNQQ